MSLRTIVRKIREVDPDVVHLSGPSLVADAAAVLCRMRGKPTVMTYHAHLNLERPVSKAFHAFSLRLALPSNDRIIVTTPLYQEELEGEGIRPDKLAIIPVGADVRRFRQGPRAWRTGRKTILFVGGLDWQHRYKRPDLLLEAFERIAPGRDLELVFVGRGEVTKDLQTKADQLGIADRVAFRPEVMDADLPREYHEADVFVLPSPSEQEGFGIVLLEAMASGTPVITSERCGGAFAVSESGAGLLYRPYDIDDLAAKILKVLEDREAWERMSHAAAEYAKGYDWSIIASRISAIYDDVLGGRAKGR
jgi:glycosyltransferase involved in cell wall biosynthesis